MRLDFTLLAAVTACAVGIVAFWSNPRRPVNRVFLSLSLHAALWLIALRSALASEEGLYWVRVASAVGAFIPLHLRIVKEAIVRPDFSAGRPSTNTVTWAVAAALLASICLSEWFVPAHSTSARKVFGPGYYGYIVGIVVAYGWLCVDAVKQMRVQTGVRRLELQILLVGGSATAIAVMLLMGLRATLEMPWLVRIQPLIILIFYSATTIAITTHRIFDARQLAFVAAHKVTLIGIVAAVAVLIDRGLELLQLPPVVAILATTALALWLAGSLNSWLDRLFHFYPEATAARHAAFDAARRETRIEQLDAAFRSVLQGWGQSDRALVLSGARDELHGGGVVMAGDDIVLQAMRQLRWATPERLTRERATPEREAVASFLHERELGVLVIGEGPALTALIGVGVAASRRPFTYPQVTQLMELASIMESALERAHFAAKVQHTEQLATVGLLGASLAHEIRNPLVTIKTFVQLLPQHHEDAAFREKFFRLIGDEVGRIDRLTEQLLDLASPRTYVATMLELHPVLRASLDLVAAKAGDKQIALHTEFQADPDRVFTDASAAKQVMLNLCFNAIQAVETQAGERWLKIATRNVPNGVEMAVADNGPGIPADIRPRLFQPFQTTKSSGFGLGLAICSDILANLNATISADPAGTGGGATFRVIFPCQPQSS